MLCADRIKVNSSIFYHMLLLGVCTVPMWYHVNDHSCTHISGNEYGSRLTTSAPPRQGLRLKVSYRSSTYMTRLYSFIPNWTRFFWLSPLTSPWAFIGSFLSFLAEGSRSGVDISDKIVYFRTSFSLWSTLTLNIDFVVFIRSWLFYRTADLLPSARAVLSRVFGSESGIPLVVWFCVNCRIGSTLTPRYIQHISRIWLLRWSILYARNGDDLAICFHNFKGDTFGCRTADVFNRLIGRFPSASQVHSIFFGFHFERPSVCLLVWYKSDYFFFAAKLMQLVGSTSWFSNCGHSSL